MNGKTLKTYTAKLVAVMTLIAVGFVFTAGADFASAESKTPPKPRITTISLKTIKVNGKTKYWVKANAKVVDDNSYYRIGATKFNVLYVPKNTKGKVWSDTRYVADSFVYRNKDDKSSYMTKTQRKNTTIKVRAKFHYYDKKAKKWRDTDWGDYKIRK